MEKSERHSGASTKEEARNDYTALRSCWDKFFRSNTLCYSMRFIGISKDDSQVIGVADLYAPRNENQALNDEGLVEFGGFGKPEFWGQG